MTSFLDFANPAPKTPKLPPAIDFLIENSDLTPIDGFYAARKDLLTFEDPMLIETHDRIGRLFLIGLISAFENYCRGILSGCISMCPLSQTCSSEKTVGLGGVIWYGPHGQLHRSAFDMKSFASSDELKKTFRDYVQFDMKTSDFGTALEQFEILSQFRHAIVHSDGVLSGRNAVKLEIPKAGRTYSIKIDYDLFQNSVETVSVLVELINREMFQLMCQRWAIEWRKRNDWNPDKDKKRLKEVYDLFVSKSVIEAKEKPSSWTVSALKKNLEAHFQI